MYMGHVQGGVEAASEEETRKVMTEKRIFER